MTISRSVLIVGGSSGLGAALALEHNRCGDIVSVVARRDDRLASLSRSAHDPRKWRSIQLDILADSAIATLMEQVPAPDLVYLVAGIGAADSDALVSTNLVRPMQLAEAYDSIGRTIVVISSLAAVVQFPGMSAYGGSKAALEHWAKTWSETSQSRVVIVRPGQFASEFFAPSDILEMENLPTSRAREVMDVADSEKGLVFTLGGRRDVLAAALSRLVGGRHARRAL